MKKNLEIALEFMGHLTIGAVVFAALLMVSGSLTMLVHWACSVFGDETLSNTMKVVEKIMLYADVAFFVWWTVLSTFRAMQAVFHEHE